VVVTYRAKDGSLIVTQAGFLGGWTGTLETRRSGLGSLCQESDTAVEARGVWTPPFDWIGPNCTLRGTGTATSSGTHTTTSEYGQEVVTWAGGGAAVANPDGDTSLIVEYPGYGPHADISVSADEAGTQTLTTYRKQDDGSMLETGQTETSLSYHFGQSGFQADLPPSFDAGSYSFGACSDASEQWSWQLSVLEPVARPTAAQVAVVAYRDGVLLQTAARKGRR
jgi:hypothetical protein